MCMQVEWFWKVKHAIIDQVLAGEYHYAGSSSGLDQAECLKLCAARAGATGCKWETDDMNGEHCWSYNGLIHHGDEVAGVICTRFYY